jgi:hypothetical protein
MNRDMWASCFRAFTPVRANWPQFDDRGAIHLPGTAAAITAAGCRFRIGLGVGAFAKIDPRLAAMRTGRFGRMPNDTEQGHQ